MKFEIKTGDVFDFEADADALVFPARRQPIRNIRGNVSDVRVSVYANGETLFEAYTKAGRVPNGSAEITENCRLKGYRYLIYTFTPSYYCHYYNPFERLRNCYINSLAVAETNNIKSVVFPVLGGGCAGFPSHKAKEFAIKVLSEYQQTHTESCIETVTLVLYDKKQEYHDFAVHNSCIRILSELNVPDIYFSDDSSISRRIKRVSDQLIRRVKSETDKIYLQYQEEKNEFYENPKNKSLKDKEKNFNNAIYQKIIDDNKDKYSIRDKLAKRIYVRDPNDISRHKNYDNSFHNNKYNDIKLGLGLELCLSDFCRLLWCMGHEFPISKMDYDLIETYIKKKNYIGALKKYRSKFIPKRSRSEYEYENEQESEREL